MNDIFFQLILFLGGIFLGIVSQLVPQLWQKRLAIGSAALLILFATFWGGYIKGGSGVATPLSCDEYGIKIVTPKDGENVSTEFEIIGSYEKQPPEGHLLIYLSLSDKQVYWPVSIIQYDKKNKTWSGFGRLVGNSPTEGFFSVALVGDDGRTLYDYSWKVGMQIGDPQSWVPIDHLTDDTDICKKILVKHTP